MDEELQRQLIEDFVVQSTEELAAFDRELLALETRDSSEETLRTIFRVIHTIKGTAGCIGLGRVERLAHMAENVLSRVQRGTLDPSSDVISTLLRTSDRLNQMVRDVERTGKDEGFEVDDLVRELEAVQSGKPAAEIEARRGGVRALRRR
jgi:two-component system chemotaxis sensor kinase CheA